MKKFLVIVFILIFSLIVVSFLPCKSSAINLADKDTETLIIKYRPLVPRSVKDSIAVSNQATISQSLRLPDTFTLKVPKGKSGEIAKRLEKYLLVEYAEQDFVAEKFETPNDPRFSEQWGLTKIEAPDAWDVTHGGTVDIAIVDTGINGNHPDLVDKIAVSVNCTISSSCPAVTPTDVDGHGTHVAGIASAITNNSIGIAGLSWEGRLMNVKALDDSGSGYYSWIANGITWAADNGAEVINLSLGGSSSSRTLQTAVDYAWGKGVVVVAAAGNSGRSSATYPAYYSKAIAVAATDSSDKKASFSNYGKWVDVAAPGVSILSTYKGDYTTLSGTSMSTPYVSGLAALLFGQNASWSNSQVRSQIESTADKISQTGKYWTYGRINACRAVGCTGGAVVEPTPTASPTPASTLTPTPTPTLTPTPTPTPKPLPWWCQYIPDHYMCK